MKRESPFKAVFDIRRSELPLALLKSSPVYAGYLVSPLP
jgi:hypothetical protein